MKKTHEPTSIELGIPEIDKDHVQLFAIMNQITHAADAGDYDDCNSLLSELVASIAVHFQYEEAILNSAKYPGIQRHQKRHAKVLDQITSVKETCKTKTGATELEDCYKTCYQDTFKLLSDELHDCDHNFETYMQEQGVARNPAPAS